METQAYFNNISQVIQEELANAQQEICVAVPWFTDEVLLQSLINRAKSKVTVRLLTLQDDINRTHGVNTDLLQDAGGKVYKMNYNEGENLMHNKFCIIDRNIVITGSYNWSKKAQYNNENITITKGNPELSLQFINEFNRLVTYYFGEEPVKDVNLGKLIKRLQVIKNFIQLEEPDEINVQLDKLTIFASEKGVKDIINDLQERRYRDAITKIESFINKYQQLSVFADPEVNALKLEIKSLEIQLASISNEKAEAEKAIIEFGIVHNRELGELISKILKLKMTLLKDAKSGNEEKEREYEQTKKDYEEYHRQYEEIKKQKHVDLSQEDKKELKQKYREAAMKCHPDRVPEEMKQQAEEMFDELQKAYNENNLEKVDTILNTINQGSFFVSRSEKVSEKVKLRAEISRLRNRINIIISELNELKSSETYKTVSEIEDWNEYFSDTKKKLTRQLSDLEKDLGLNLTNQA